MSDVHARSVDVQGNAHGTHHEIGKPQGLGDSQSDTSSSPISAFFDPTDVRAWYGGRSSTNVGLADSTENKSAETMRNAGRAGKGQKRKDTEC
ncbi:hypothetical protein RhiJN_17229 [Ceratobasidium sp. AG-Ba]|nr:hypothetical protein RhiJN_17229 [Ceratobasidium sp. AG-Ba]